MIRSRIGRPVVGVCMVVAGLSVGGRAAAQTTLNQYRPAETVADGFAISRPNDVGHLRFGAQLQFDYAKDPLVFESSAGDADSENAAVVGHQFAGHLALSLGVLDRLVFFAGLPVNLVMEGDDEAVTTFGQPEPDGFSVGDAYLGFRLRLFGEEDDVFALGFQGSLFVPLADAADPNQIFAGDDNVVGLTELLAEVRAGIVRIGFNVGARIREDVEFGSVELGSELTYGLGFTFSIVDETLFALAEIYGSSAFNNFAGREESPLEAIAGMKYHHRSGFTVGAAAGPGLQRGFGSPDVRAVALLGYLQPEDPEPEPVEEPKDSDGDGLLDDRDRCPREPEDVDEFEDQDGCPDPDNDQDGVLDVNDGAPLEPEDRDEFQDEDGVPDPDNDGDGVTDDMDNCPNEVGPASNQGCPEPDRDGDGVPDRVDNCPDEPGPKENHGCEKEQLVVIERDRLQILDKVYFRTNSARIRSRSFTLLDNVASVINAHPEIGVVQVDGHSDERGRRAFNLRLSKRRAEAVRKYLISKGGVEEKRVLAEGYGPDQPIVADATTAEDHAKNRRVEFNIVPKPTVEPAGATPESPAGNNPGTEGDAATGSGDAPVPAE